MTLRLAQPEQGMALIMARSPRDEKIRSWEIAQALEITPALDTARLARAFQHVIHLHPRLRAVYRIKDGKVIGRLLPIEEFALQVCDAYSMRDAEFAAFLRQRADQPCDIEQGPLIEVTALSRPRNRMVLLLRINHLIIDGWSIEVLLRDMMMHYLGVAGILPRPLDFEAFVDWEERFTASPAGLAQRAFWRRKLAAMGPRLPLPFDRPPASPLITASGSEHFAIDTALTKNIGELAKRNGVSVFAILLAAFQVLLSGLTARNDIVVTTTTSRRNKAEFANIVGFMGNLIGLRGTVADDVAFGRQVVLANRTTAEALANQDLHILEVIDELAGGRRDANGNADLGDSCFDQVALCMLTPNIGEVPDAGLRLKYNPGSSTKVGPFKLRMLELDRSHCTRDLTLYYNELDDRIACFFAYSADVFDGATVAELAERFRAILQAGCSQPGLPLSSLKALARRELAGVHGDEQRPHGPCDKPTRPVR